MDLTLFPNFYLFSNCFITFQSSSSQRQSHLESLYDFVSQATQELIWLNEKEEEEVAFDWSDRNSSISKKRQYHDVSLASSLPLPATFFQSLGCVRTFKAHKYLKQRSATGKNAWLYQMNHLKIRFKRSKKKKFEIT